MSYELDLTPQERDKAPKWLLAKFDTAIRELNRLQVVLDGLSGRADSALVKAGNMVFPTGLQDGRDVINLPSSARIRFKIEAEVGEYVDVCRPYNFGLKRHDGLGIEIQASGRIAHMQGASNVLVISTVEGMKRLLARGGL